MSSAHASTIAPQFGGTQRTACARQHVRYDALVSIAVPPDKARAVVDAMEHDMGTTLATKQDLEFQTLATRKDLEIVRLAMKQDFEILRAETKQSIDGLRADMQQTIELLKRDIAAQDYKLTIKLGIMLFLGLGLVVAVLSP
jgi:hypothetical protein